MCESERVDAADAANLARACFQNIAAAIQDSINRAERLGATDMVERLIAAKATADRGSELTDKLAAILKTEQLDDSSLPSD